MSKPEEMRALPAILQGLQEDYFTQAEIDEAAWMGISFADSFAGSPAMVFYEQLKNS